MYVNVPLCEKTDRGPPGVWARSRAERVKIRVFFRRVARSRGKIAVSSVPLAE